MKEEYNWLFHEHSVSEEMLEECIEQADLNLWSDCEATFGALMSMLKKHMAMEEEVLFPAYERHTDLPRNPVEALRSDHDQLVQLFCDIDEVLKTRDSEHLVDAIKPVVVAMNHHHDKEENFFLPMAGHLLLPYRDSIIEEMKNFDPSTASRQWPI
ncbi:MAG: hemerythrin domain-containing protein [Halieaceae bacterium]|jgi:hemerythrin-like domain-containing protein|nr:hemerythrin domain-containing protein [Halieaceae bacterium]